jgi:hypothetical protein
MVVVQYRKKDHTVAVPATATLEDLKNVVASQRTYM